MTTELEKKQVMLENMQETFDLLDLMQVKLNALPYIETNFLSSDRELDDDISGLIGHVQILADKFVQHIDGLTDEIQGA